MGMLVLSSEAKELCLDSWALAASALFQSALISMEARYSVCRGRRAPLAAARRPGADAGRYLLRVSAGVQARHQVEHVAQGHRVQVLDERGEEVVDVAAAVLQLERQRAAAEEGAKHQARGPHPARCSAQRLAPEPWRQAPPEPLT